MKRLLLTLLMVLLAAGRGWCGADAWWFATGVAAAAPASFCSSYPSAAFCDDFDSNTVPDWLASTVTLGWSSATHSTYDSETVVTLVSDGDTTYKDFKTPKTIATVNGQTYSWEARVFNDCSAPADLRIFLYSTQMYRATPACGQWLLLSGTVVADRTISDNYINIQDDYGALNDTIHIDYIRLWQ